MNSTIAPYLCTVTQHCVQRGSGSPNSSRPQPWLSILTPHFSWSTISIRLQHDERGQTHCYCFVRLCKGNLRFKGAYIIEYLTFSVHTTPLHVKFFQVYLQDMFIYISQQVPPSSSHLALGWLIQIRAFSFFTLGRRHSL